MHEMKHSEHPSAPHRFWGRFQLKELIGLFVVLATLYGLIAFERLGSPSEHLHFVDLANSFLHGRLDTETPSKKCRNGKTRGEAPKGYDHFVCRHVRKADGSWEGWNDWATLHTITLKDGEQLKGVWPYGDTSGSDKYHFRTLDGDLYIIDKKKDLKKGCDKKNKFKPCVEKKHFVSFPPVPALMMAPLVAFLDYRLNDVIWTICIAVLGIMALLLLLEKLSEYGWSQRSRAENLLLASLVAFGTSFFFSAVRGEVWFTALIVGFFFNVLYLGCAVQTRHPFLAGCMLALAMGTRPPLAFGCVFFGLQLLLIQDWKEQIRRGLWFSLPILVAGGALMAFNLARFDHAFEFGHTYLQDGMRPAIREHGLFNLHFLKANFTAAFANVPLFLTKSPFVQITRHGISILATTPLFLLLLWPRRIKTDIPAESQHLGNKRLWIMALALVCVALPGLFYQNTGWSQFSYRFSIDYLPYLVMILACRGYPINRLFQVLFGLSVLISLFGAITFGRLSQFYYG